MGFRGKRHPARVEHHAHPARRDGGRAPPQAEGAPRPPDVALPGAGDRQELAGGCCVVCLRARLLHTIFLQQCFFSVCPFCVYRLRLEYILFKYKTVQRFIHPVRGKGVSGENVASGNTGDEC